MEPSDPLIRLVRDALRERMRLAFAFAGVVLLGAAQLYLTWLIKEWVDGPLATGRPEELTPLLVKAALALVVTSLALFASRALIADVNHRIVASLRDRAVARVIAVPVAVARRFPDGELVSRLFNDAGVLSSFLTTLLRRTLREVVVVAGAIVLLFVLDWRLATAAFTLVPLTAWILDRIGRVIRRWSRVAQSEVGSLTGIAVEQFSGLTTIKGFQTESFESRRFAATNASYRRKVVAAEVWAALLLCAVFLVTGTGFLLMVLAGSRALAEGAISQATLLAFALYAGQIVEPLRRLSEIHGSMQLAVVAAGRVYEIVDLDPLEDVIPATAAPFEGAVEFRDVSFAYRESDDVLEGVSLRIAPRERVAVVAASGGGKSTLAALLPRFHDPSSGVVLLDGRDVRALPLAAVRRAVCLVEQQPFLFSGALEDNIRYGSPDASAGAIDEAVRLAGLQDFVAALPQGLATAMREAGREMSGGEKQRVALARAVVRDPAILILDEATSALDSDLEAEIFRKLDAWMRQRTVIVMAHRLSTVSRCERVVVLADGRVVADGPTQVVSVESSAFRELFREQMEIAFR